MAVLAPVVEAARLPRVCPMALGYGAASLVIAMQVCWCAVICRCAVTTLGWMRHSKHLRPQLNPCYCRSAAILHKEEVLYLERCQC